MKKIISAILAASMAACVLTACGGSSAPASSAAPAAPAASSEAAPAAPANAVVLKCGTKMSTESVEGQAFQHFADLVAEKTNGEVTVDIYPSEQLGDTSTQMDNLQLGTQDLYIEGIALWARYDSIFDYGNIPFLFTSYEDYQAKTLGDVDAKEQEVLLANGMRMLTTNRNWIRGPYRVLVTTEPFSVDSVKDLRIRSFDSAVYGTAWSKLGANPLTLAWTDVYMGLQQGTVAAAASPVSLVYDMKFTECAKYVNVINEFPQEIGVVMSEKSYQKLTAEQQAAMIEAANEAAEWSNELLASATDELINKMETEHGATIVEIDTTPLHEQLIPWFQELEQQGTIPAGLI